ncbi:hypothetical protein B0A52_09500 [Exophiala mesophila]|uniref:Zn(2)-C6 fungal-type domain-containing protein n=1 Tax=Exophiala mesophila TaxID=212818 RepID=A0A438MSQ4_EXOME|nr:hypothetical protein B0A52_09500 [Exophiala mesophila]
MSLRLSSLDPNEPRATKDCRICNRRRIKCDRSLPTCKKCDLKSLSCPGYGLRIQWGQGVASRGKLTGKTLPVLEPVSAAESDKGVKGSLDPTNSAASLGDRLTKNESTSTSSLSESLPTPDATTTPLDSTVLETMPEHLPSLLQDPGVQELLQHYDTQVASVMPWIDGPTNGWRTVMLPLTTKSLSLLLAILALAAEHFTVTKKQNRRSDYYRDWSLRLLAQDLRKDLEEDSLGERNEHVSGTLATILILCNMEMIRSDNELWTVHWKAVRTITRRWTTTNPPTLPLDPSLRFLMKEAFVYDVFASSTTFHQGESIPASIVSDSDRNIFSDWLEIIQQVTHTERCLHDDPNSAQVSHHLRDANFLRDRFEYARASSLHYSHLVQLNSGATSLRSDLAQLIDIFHYSGLLYSFQALLNIEDSRPARQELVQHTIHSIDQVQECNAFQHDFVWPLFIIGTESRASPDLQRFVESRVQTAMRSTGFSNCEPSLRFLQRFWQTSPDTVVDWLQFGRQEADRGFTFLVI